MLPPINNSFYDELGERWYQDESHPIALLRAESKLKLRYIRETLSSYPNAKDVSILDIGCGAGLLSIPLAKDGYQVKGIDLSPNSIKTAEEHAEDISVTFEVADAYALTDKREQYDVVLMMDF